MRTRLLGVGAISLTLALVGCGGDEAAVGGPTPEVEVDPPEARDPGRVTWHRLNRTEYNNTVRDLLGTSLRPADEFPDDDSGYGFDNIANVLSLSPLHLELYDRAASKLAEDILREPLLEPAKLFIQPESEGTAEVGAPWGAEAWNLWSEGALTGARELPLRGRYRVVVRAFGLQAGDEPVKMGLALDGEEVATWEVEAEVGAPQVFELERTLEAGEHTLSVSFLNDYYNPEAGEDRSLVVDYFGFEGPLDLPDPALSPRARVLTCSPESIGHDACARQILGDLARRAWRRPVERAEIDRLLRLVTLGMEDGLGFEGGLSLAFRGILVSPWFIFRVERDAEPTSPEARALDDYAMASRLSYFIWSSMPDEALFAAAERGELSTPAQIAAQVERMLADPKAAALVDGFADQWLYIRDIKNAFPDIWVFPSFDEPLRAAMIEEMRLFFATFLEEDRSMKELLTARDTFANRHLAEFYGLPGASGLPADGFERVSLEGTDRGGILTMAGILTVLSTPFRTSIVRRGKWVLGQLLCSEPPPPPPGVEGLIEEQGQLEGTLREVLEQHREDPICASCHVLMDPIGFGLENFNGIGQWRDVEAGVPIDASGELPDGSTFAGAQELQTLLADDPRFAECVTEKLFVYALGRGPRAEDEGYLEDMTHAFADGGYRLRDLVRLVATSEPFRYRAGEAPSEEGAQ